MGQLLKGKAVADSIAVRVKKEAEKLRAGGIAPKLKIVRVGERKDDIAYETSAVKRLRNLNIDCDVLLLPFNIDQDSFIEELIQAVEDVSVHGILLFRPLPEQINENDVKF